MTQVITRYFEDAGQAQAVRRELVLKRRFPDSIVRVYDTSKGLAKALKAADVEADAAKAYQKSVGEGGAVLMVRAGHKPLAVAKTARQVTAEMGAADMGDIVEEVRVPDEDRGDASVFTDHRHMLLRKKDPSRKAHRMADWPIPLISRRVPYSDSAIPRHGRMANFPIPLISKRKPYTDTVIEPHGRMADWPIPLLSKRKPYTESIFPPHARMANFPIPLISRRKPYTGTLIGKHPRMANWPFPHLIDGETGTNSLVPGAPRMANWPIQLLSKREPYTVSAIPRHGRMANFPIPLISKRKPYTGSIIPKHGRMADMILPLVIRRPEADKDDGDKKRFSFSKLLGLPTLVAR